MENGSLQTPRNTKQTMRLLLCGAVLAVVVLLGTATTSVSATPMLNHHQRPRRGRTTLSRNTKVRGKFQRHENENHQNRRELMSGKGGKGGEMGSTGDAGASGDGYATDYDNGDGSHHTNIFDHTNTKVTEVACGSATSPFLSTFVTSIEFTGSTVPGGGGGGGGGGGSGGSKKSSKSKKMSSTKKSTSGSLKSGTLKSGTASGKGKGGKGGGMMGSSTDGNKYPTYSGDGFGTDIITPGDDDEYATQGELPVNELSTDEQRLMERIFRDVYNGFTFEFCDGFFRTVYTVSMTMAERNEVDPNGIYSVSLSRTFTNDNDDIATTDDGVYSSSSTGYTPTYTPGTRRDRRHRQLNETKARQGYWADPYNYDEGADSAVPVAGASSSVGVDGSLTRTQTVVGSELVTIYYVSLTATCRNCAVTPEVNFPLLMIPESEVSQAEDTSETYTGASYFTDEVCTCPAYSVEEEAYSRNRKNRRELQQEDLYHPPPRGPTSEELIEAINSVIARNDDLGRIVGLVQLIEPDYFNGENPDRIDAGTTAPNATGPPVWTPATLFPTATPLTRPPTFTLAPTTSGDREIVVDSGAIANPSAFVMVTSSVLLSAVLLWWN